VKYIRKYIRYRGTIESIKREKRDVRGNGRSRGV